MSAQSFACAAPDSSISRTNSGKLARDAVGAADETVAIFHETYSGSLESLKNWGA